MVKTKWQPIYLCLTHAIKLLPSSNWPYYYTRHQGGISGHLKREGCGSWGHREGHRVHRSCGEAFEVMLHGHLATTLPLANHQHPTHGTPTHIKQVFKPGRGEAMKIWRNSFYHIKLENVSQACGGRERKVMRNAFTSTNFFHWFLAYMCNDGWNY